MDNTHVVHLTDMFEDKIRNIETINSTLLIADENSENLMAESTVDEPSKIFERALESDFNSEDELKAKKIIAAALLIAKHQNKLPDRIPNNISTVDVAVLSDDTITREKVSYQVGEGKIDPYVAIDILIDKATARAIAIADKYVEKGVDFAINKVGKVVEASFPQARPVVEMMKRYQPVISKYVQSSVKSGIKAIGKVSKLGVRKVGEVLHRATSKIKNKLFS